MNWRNYEHSKTGGQCRLCCARFIVLDPNISLIRLHKDLIHCLKYLLYWLLGFHVTILFSHVSKSLGIFFCIVGLCFNPLTEYNLTFALCLFLWVSEIPASITKASIRVICLAIKEKSEPLMLRLWPRDQHSSVLAGPYSSSRGHTSTCPGGERDCAHTPQ